MLFPIATESFIYLMTMVSFYSSHLCHKAITGLDLCEHFISVNELGRTILKALKTLLYDGIHFLVGVGA